MEKINYQRQTEAVLAALEGRPRLLLHSCCGPCSSYVLEYLTGFFQVDLLFYNPNIQPQEEYEKRLDWQTRTLRALGLESQVPLLAAPYRGGDFQTAALGLEQEPEHGARCTACFRLRLEETARQAKAGDYPWFATTLTISPHKNPAIINAIGTELAAQYGLSWLPADFKKRGGYQRSIALCREHGIYRQNSCGCAFSRPAPSPKA